MIRRAGLYAIYSVVLTLSSTLSAAAPLKVLGFDDMSCQAWAQSKDDTEIRARYIAWVRGFLSGHNYARPAQQVSEISNGTVEMFVTRYCNEKPRDTFSAAAQRMSDQYSGRNTPITK
ncbi:MAG: hypothetical protein FWD62_07055 [Betaproteobacteria bacterium]|nr:hypothetical protein [Betaproteobacteria bacterium]